MTLSSGSGGGIGCTGVGSLPVWPLIMTGPEGLPIAASASRSMLTRPEASLLMTRSGTAASAAAGATATAAAASPGLLGDLLAADAAERTRRNRPNVQVVADLEESVVHGVPASIERAVANLLDNAAKWSPPGGKVELSVSDGVVVVRDHGPGIDEADLPYVFDRFYRARSARGMPGSGLGLAIVRQVAESHGGQVVAERAEGGGTRVTLRLNGRAVS